jgi:U3 small nucleolar RNA-associated protein 23
MENEALRPSAHEQLPHHEQDQQRKRQGPKGPNPLSVKKKASKITNLQMTQALKRKRTSEEETTEDRSDPLTKRKRKRRKKTSTVASSESFTIVS